MKQRIEKIGISGIRSFTALFKDMEDMLYLTIGEPDFDTPSPIKEAAKKALDDNITHYPPALGLDKLRERIALEEAKKFNEAIDKDHIIVTNGATEGLVLALWTLLNEGDRVVQILPGYTLYPSQASLAGATICNLDITKTQFQITKEALEACIDINTKAILLTSPNNPTGQTLNKESLDAVRDVMIKNPQLYAIVDDVYDTFIYDGPLESLRSYEELRGRIVVVQAFSKSKAMTGWRIGYVIANPLLIDQMHKLHQNLMAGVSSISQMAALASFDVDTSYMKEEYKERRDYVYKRLKDMGLDVLKPQGAFYIFPNISKYNMSSYDFAFKCATQANLAMIPGVYFGADAYVRLSYCYSMDVLKEACDRLESFIKTLD